MRSEVFHIVLSGIIFNFLSLHDPWLVVKALLNPGYLHANGQQQSRKQNFTEEMKQERREETTVHFIHQL